MKSATPQAIAPIGTVSSQDIEWLKQTLRELTPGNRSQLQNTQTKGFDRRAIQAILTLINFNENHLFRMSFEQVGINVTVTLRDENTKARIETTVKRKELLQAFVGLAVMYRQQRAHQRLKRALHQIAELPRAEHKTILALAKLDHPARALIKHVKNVNAAEDAAAQASGDDSAIGTGIRSHQIEFTHDEPKLADWPITPATMSINIDIPHIIVASMPGKHLGQIIEIDANSQPASNNDKINSRAIDTCNSLIIANAKPTVFGMTIEFETARQMIIAHIEQEERYESVAKALEIYRQSAEQT